KNLWVCRRSRLFPGGQLELVSDIDSEIEVTAECIK
ncbi:MAG: hypothetical protein ACI8TA_003614, partial [Cyclobacteriaceae bacterium]